MVKSCVGIKDVEKNAVDPGTMVRVVVRMRMMFKTEKGNAKSDGGC